jgi:hypothetical protein
LAFLGVAAWVGPTLFSRTDSPDGVEDEETGRIGPVVPTARDQASPLGEGRPLPGWLEPSADFVPEKEGLRSKNRHYLRTKAGDFLNKDFRFEVVYSHRASGEDLTFIGLGAADREGTFHEPAGSAFLRIHPPSIDAGWISIANTPAQGSIPFGHVKGPGRRRVVLEKKGRAVTFSVYVDNAPSANLQKSVTDIEAFAPFLDDANAHLFFGGGGLFHSVALIDGPAGKPPKPRRVVEDPPSPLPAIPAPNLAGRTEVKFAEPFLQVRTGGAGRYLIFHFKKAKKLSVFDVSRVKTTHEIEVPDDVLYAAGIEKLFVVVPGQRLLQRWDLRTGKREKTAPIPEGGALGWALMGPNSHGPLLLFTGKVVVPWDTEKMKPSGADVTGLGGDPGYKFEGRISGDGRTVVVWHGGLSPNQYARVRLCKDKNQVTASPDGHSFNGRWAMPNADGSLIFRYGPGMYDGDMRPIATAGIGAAVLLPSQDPRFFLGIKEESATTDQVLICTSADRQVVHTVPGVEKTTYSVQGSLWGVSGPVPRVYYLPSANVLVNLRQWNEGMVLRPLNLLAELNRSGRDYLFVVSRPAAAVAPGGTFTYRIQAHSKVAGLKYKLESGPDGMTVSPAGVVRWQAPNRAEGKPMQVIVGVKSASGKEVQHAFSLAVRE